MPENILTVMASDSQEMYTHSVGDGKVCFVEREVEKFDYDGFEIASLELFSSTNFPTVTLKYGYIVFNTRAIKTLDECSHIKILIRSDKKFMIVMPCTEDEKDAVRWCRVDKHGNVKPKTISGKSFAALLCRDMNRYYNSTVKMKGTFIEKWQEKLLVFSLTGEKVPKHGYFLFTKDMLN